VKLQNNDLLEMDDPITLAIENIVEKNFWLTKIRWVFSLFILMFFTIYNSLQDKIYIDSYRLFLVIFLSVLGNIIFIFALKKESKKLSKDIDYDKFSFIASLQLDFDLVVLVLLVYLSAGFESPVIVLFIFYVIISTFIIEHKKAFKNTLTSIVLLLLIFFKNEGFGFSSEKLASMTAFNTILFFSYFISAYVSKNFKKNEAILQELLKKTRKLSVTDGLTGLCNQTHFFSLLKSEVETSKKYNLVFSIIIFDVDHFKNYNDNNGHILGSKTLAKVGLIMKKAFRASDILAKYGGDEFVIILPKTDKIGAFLAADRLRGVIEEEEFIGQKKQPFEKITISLGIASYPSHGLTDEEILGKADKALYFAKETGRNKTIIYNKSFENIES
jgi:diguanylate cyclase (GGDEF)-like protein